MKLTNNISIYLCLVLSSSLILADYLSGLNQASDSPIIQTDPNYSLSPTPEYYNDIIDSEQNGINNPDKFLKVITYNGKTCGKEVISQAKMNRQINNRLARRWKAISNNTLPQFVR